LITLVFRRDCHGKTRLDHVHEMLSGGCLQQAFGIQSRFNGSHPYTRHKVKLFRVGVSGKRADWVAIKDLAQNFTRAVQNAPALRWKIEQFHREAKQLAGGECQCRKAGIQRNHIACAVLVWVRLAAIARKTCTTIYKIKSAMLSKYLRQELLSPSVRMKFL